MRARIGVFALIAAVLTIGVCGDAAAKTQRKRHLHARRPVSESGAQLVPQQQVRLGAMRYYGGPKSPMWREVR
jgi:hypothetical protein